MTTSCLKFLTFDVNNTILKVRGSPAIVYSQTAKRYGVDISKEDIDKVYRQTWKRKKQEHPCYGLQQKMSTKQWWGDFVEKVFKNAGYSGDTRKLNQIFETLYSDFEKGTNWEIIPGSHEVLDKLKISGLKLGIVSNVDDRITTILDRHNLSKYFDIIVTPVCAKAEKPNPAIFHYTLQKSGFRGNESGHVGDSIRNDYFCAKEAGLTPFLLDPSHEVSQGEINDVNKNDIIQELKELENIILG